MTQSPVKIDKEFDVKNHQEILACLLRVVFFFHVSYIHISQDKRFSLRLIFLYLLLFILPNNHGLGSHALALHKHPSLAQDAHAVLDHALLDTLRSSGEAHRLQPLPGIRLRVPELRRDVLDRLVHIIMEVLHAQVQLFKQRLHAAIDATIRAARKLGRRDDLPAAPGGVNLADPANLARVVVLLGGEVLPHEEVGRARVDGVAEVLKVVEHDIVAVGLAAGGKPAVLVGEDEAHYVAAGADARDANLAAFEEVDRGDFGALCASRDCPA